MLTANAYLDGLNLEQRQAVEYGLNDQGNMRMLKHIAEFFAIERDIRGRSAEERRLIRQQRGRPLADAFQKWLRTKCGLISQKGKLAAANPLCALALEGPGALP